MLSKSPEMNSPIRNIQLAVKTNAGFDVKLTSNIHKQLINHISMNPLACILSFEVETKLGKVNRSIGKMSVCENPCVRELAIY